MASPDPVYFVNDVANPFSENDEANSSPVHVGFVTGPLEEPRLNEHSLTYVTKRVPSPAHEMPKGRGQAPCQGGLRQRHHLP